MFCLLKQFYGRDFVWDLKLEGVSLGKRTFSIFFLQDTSATIYKK